MLDHALHALLLNRVGRKLLLVLTAPKVSTEADRPNRHQDDKQQSQAEQQWVGAHDPSFRGRWTSLAKLGVGELIPTHR